MLSNVEMLINLCYNQTVWFIGNSSSGAKMKRIGKVNIIMLVLSAFVTICYLPYLIMLILRGETLSSWVIPIIVLLLATVPAALYIVRRDKLNRFLKILRIIYIAGMSFYALTFTVFTTYIAVSSHGAASVQAFAHTDGGKDDIILVFGCRTYGYTPGQQLKARLDTAFELLESMPEAVCIVSGGEGENEGVAEAVSMRSYLVKRGIDEKRIYMEADSHNTYENIEKSMELIEREGLVYDRIIGVSTDFHLPRIEYLFEHYGIEAYTVSAPSLDFSQFFLSVVREYMAYVKLFLVT